MYLCIKSHHSRTMYEQVNCIKMNIYQMVEFESYLIIIIAKRISFFGNPSMCTCEKNGNGILHAYIFMFVLIFLPDLINDGLNHKGPGGGG